QGLAGVTETSPGREVGQLRLGMNAYVLRHSAASFFLSQKCLEISRAQGAQRPNEYADVPDRVKDLMKLRFGWTVTSKMPEIYAARALSDQAQVTLSEFHQSLMQQVEKLRQRKER
ncbi:hypothetical protein, partial [Marinobacter goseongensis]|uniref:hypothetical protein n=1 Tax=Marinobacter goseongensis TaxID=453838 RepID=UPI002005BFF2